MLIDERPPLEPARVLMAAHPDPPRRSLFGRAARRVLREGAAIFVRIMELGHRFGRGLLRTEHVVAGGCKKRGACCHHILLEWSPWLDRHPLAARFVLWKLTRFYSFYDKGYSWEVQDGLVVRVLGCHALGADGSCTEYRLRPLFCRTYPEVPLTGRPQVLRGCGYSFPKRGGKATGAPVEESESLVSIGRRIR